MQTSTPMLALTAPPRPAAVAASLPGSSIDAIGVSATSANASSTGPRSKPDLAWLHIVRAEIANVTAAMRKNARWAVGTGAAYASAPAAAASVSASAAASAGLDSRRPSAVGQRVRPARRAGLLALAAEEDYDPLAGLAAAGGGPAVEAVLDFVGSPARPPPDATPRKLAFLPQGFETPLLHGFTKLKARLALIQ
ncbi:hypothetical protein HK405_001548, partial [Cladochytrium tenue]